ncbi:hypothetical protein CTAYLR_007036 [Chrysophaeum taylorii]|uniref:Protein kinase domain-containing protein n=1 Tax=Chrysophaeum taylorii TaxID=2483200 RepID=A0AAD7XI82_9STRA|nr:hypothetical protein CTAYLR_007036 [Chrysophaeum taylorii]
MASSAVSRRSVGESPFRPMLARTGDHGDGVPAPAMHVVHPPSNTHGGGGGGGPAAPPPPSVSSSPSRSRIRREDKEKLRLYQSLWLSQTAIPFVKDATSEYDIVRQIGKGTFSTVYFARHEAYPEGVAMKLIDKSRVTETSDVRKVLRNVRRVNTEVNLMRSCVHDGICALFDAFQTTQNVFIIMDYVERDLFHLLSGFPGGLPDKLARSMNHIIARSIRYLHTQGIAHRDIKPENILVKGSLQNDDDLLVKLCDFGLSLRPEAKCSDFVGSPGFFAPEVLLEKVYDAFKCDVWSFGAVLLETLIGTPKFGEVWLQAYCVLDSRSVFSEAVAASIRRLETLETVTSDPDLGDIILGALRYAPADRATIDAIANNPWLLPDDENDVDAACLKILRLSIDGSIPEIPSHDTQNDPLRRDELQSAGGDWPRLNLPDAAEFRGRAKSFGVPKPHSPPRVVQREAESTLPAMTICHLDDSQFVRRVVEAKLSMAFPCHRLINFSDSMHLVHIIMASQQKQQDSPLNQIRVCIFDEHIRENIKGSDIAKMLRVLGYEGLVFSMTADYESHLEDPQLAVVYDGVLSKRIGTPELHKTLVTAWRDKYGQQSLVPNALLSPAAQTPGGCDFKALRIKCLQQILKGSKVSLTHAELLEFKGDFESVKCSPTLLATVRRCATDNANADSGEIPFDDNSPLYVAIRAELESNTTISE